MGKVLKWIWRGLRGLVFSLGLAMLALIAYAVILTTAVVERAPPRPERMVLTMTVAGELAENPADPSLGLGGGGTNLHRLTGAIRDAAADPAVRGLAMEVGPTLAGLQQLEELAQALQVFRDAGKPILAYADNFGTVVTPGTRSYLLAAMADRIFLNPMGVLALTGVEARQTYLAETLDRFGLGVDVVRFNEAKTAFNFLSERDMTAAERQQLEREIATLEDLLVSRIAARRGLEPEHVVQVMRTGPHDSLRAVELQMVTDVAQRDVLDWGLKDQGEAYRMAHYMATADDLEAPERSVAVIFMEGMIVEGGGEDDGAFALPVIAPNAYARLIEEVAEDEAVAAIVVRIDSGGGSALGSEVIRQALADVPEAKPVVVSMGNAAASGGYWLALGGDHVLAGPFTVTGSIGVIGMFPNYQDLARDLGATVATVSGRTASPARWDPSRPLTGAARAKMEALLGDTYRKFVALVAERRGLTIAEVEAVAGGQVWIGQEAAERGLVDGLGGLRDAVRIAKERAGMDPDSELPLFIYPQQPSLLEQLRALAGSGVAQVQRVEAALTRLATLADGLTTLVPGSAGWPGAAGGNGIDLGGRSPAWIHD